MVLFNCFVVIDYFLVCFYNFGKSDTKDQHWKQLLFQNYPNLNVTALGYISAFLKVIFVVNYMKNIAFSQVMAIRREI